METVIVGARGSRLAQVMVSELITLLGECPVVRLKPRAVMTDGDRDRKASLRELGGADSGGLFTNQLQKELLAGRIDVAVHSLKDLPTGAPEGLVLAITPPRQDPRDAMCGSTLAGLRHGARVGTGSARRVAQLLALRPDLEIVPIRGNVPPRLGRLKSGLDAVVLATAGLRRLGLDDAITEVLDPGVFPPSPGQGALAVQVRAADHELLQMLSSYGDLAADAAVLAERRLLAELLQMLSSYGDLAADAAVLAERRLLAELHGGCSVPIGAYAVHSSAGLVLNAQVTSLDGRQRVTAAATGDDPQSLGAHVAAFLRERGAEAILSAIQYPVSPGTGPVRLLRR